MIKHLQGMSFAGLALSALLTLGTVPALAGPPTIGYRNDTKVAVVVQGLSIINNRLRRDRVHILQPGEVAYDTVAIAGNRLVVVADAKQPTRTLFQGTIPFARNDQFFSIRIDSAAGKDPKGQPVPLTKVKLVRDTPPATGDNNSPSTPRR
jgi:hypothetical protein